MNPGGYNNAHPSSVSTQPTDTIKDQDQDKSIIHLDSDIFMSLLKNTNKEYGASAKPPPPALLNKNIQQPNSKARSFKRPKEDSQDFQNSLKDKESSSSTRTANSNTSSSSGNSVTKTTLYPSMEIRNNRYTSDNHGPYDVHIQKYSDPNSSLYPVTVGRIMASLNIKNILEVKKVGYSKVSIFLKTFDAVNKLVNNPMLAQKDLIAFIPPSRMSRKGIIRNIPLDLTEETILNNINSFIIILYHYYP